MFLDGSKSHSFSLILLTHIKGWSTEVCARADKYSQGFTGLNPRGKCSASPRPCSRYASVSFIKAKRQPPEQQLARRDDAIAGRHNTALQRAATQFCGANSMKATARNPWVERASHLGKYNRSKKACFPRARLGAGDCTTAALRGFSALVSGKRLLR